jgi:hypothetical protein
MTRDDTSEQMEARLLRGIAQTRFEVLAENYIWQQMTDNQRPSRKAIACVRDGQAWYQFLPAGSNAATERYRVVSFHFKEGTDADGFVAWLAGHLKRRAQSADRFRGDLWEGSARQPRAISHVAGSLRLLVLFGRSR